MKLGDKLLVIVGVLCLVVAFGYTKLIKTSYSEVEKQVVIEVDGDEYKRFPLKHTEPPEVIPVGDPKDPTLVVQMKDGQVRVIESHHCPNKICMQMGPASEVGDMIVCLPNEVFITIEGPDGEEEFDSFSF